MLEDYLILFNDCLDAQDMDGALNYIDKIFIDSKYIKVKNLFLYLLGCIFELPDKYLNYVKTLFNYDLKIPVNNIFINEENNIIKNILYHYFGRATNIYYEYMQDAYSIECKNVLLNLLHIAYGANKTENRVLNNLYKKQDYYALYTYLDNLVNKHPTFNNMYFLYLLLKDYITKDYYSNKDNNKYNYLIETVRHKQYEQLLMYFQRINYSEEDNFEITIIIDVLKHIIAEKDKYNDLTKEEETKPTNFDKEMFLDFLVSVEDVVDKEGFVILNPESKEINKTMRNLAYYLPNLASYEIGGIKKQVVINARKQHYIDNDSIKELKIESYNKGDSFAYIEYALSQIKYSIPTEFDAIKLAQSYFRVGLIDEGLRALKLAIGIYEYDNKHIFGSKVLNYYMMQDYFTNINAKKLARNRQK